MPATRNHIPTGAISNMEKASSPCLTAIPLTKILVEVPINVQTPPSKAPKDSGISNFAGLILVSLATCKTIGINRATTAVSLINADKIPAETMIAMRHKI